MFMIQEKATDNHLTYKTQSSFPEAKHSYKYVTY